MPVNTPPCHEKTPRRARVIKGVIRTPDKSGLDHYKGGLRRLRKMYLYSSSILTQCSRKANLFVQYFEKCQSFTN